jgi:hypothetical protein
MHMPKSPTKALMFCASLIIAGCAPLYVQPPAAGNALVRVSLDGDVELTSQQYWLNARDCSERMRLSSEESRAFATGGSIVLSAGKEFAVTLHALRKAELRGGFAHTEVCDAGASFTPQQGIRYRIAFTADQNHCKVLVFRDTGAPSRPREEIDPTFRTRKVRQHSCTPD